MRESLLGFAAMLEALLPFISIPSKTLGTLPFLGTIKLQVFGPLVITGVLLGIRRCLAYAKGRDIDEFVARDVMFYALISGFIISHWVSVIFYFWDDVVANPLLLLQVWNGLSSVGGFFGGMVGVLWFLTREKQPFLVFVDMLTFGMLVGFTFGRLGCSLVHDHPGLIVDPSHPFYALAVHGWKGSQVARWDLGLFEFVYLVPLALYFHLVYDWKNAWPGKLVGTVCLFYGPYRLFLDTMRQQDTRYFGLTPAQYFTFAIIALGIYFVFIRKQRPSDLEWAKDSERIAAEKKAAEEAAGDNGAAVSDADIEAKRAAQAQQGE